MNRKKILGFAIGPIGSALLGVLSVPLLAWSFSSEDIGRISMLQVATDFIVLLFGFGLDRAYVREYHEAQTEDSPGLLMTAALPGFFLLALVILAILVYAPTLFAHFLFSIDSNTLSVFVASCVLAAFISRYLSLILRMQEKGLAFSMSQILPKVLFLTMIGFYIILGVTLDFNKLVLAHTAALIAVMLIYTWNTKSIWWPGLLSGISKEKLVYMLEFGLPLAFASLAYWALVAMDKLFLRNLSSFAELGTYSVATSIASSASIVSSVFTTIWAPTVYKWVAEGINSELVDKISEHVLAAATAVFIFCGLFSWLLKFLLPTLYANVQFIAPACMAAPLFFTLSETTAVGMGIARKSFYSMAASFLAATVNFVGNYAFVPKLGATGAGISTAIAFWIFLILRTEFSSMVWRPLPRLKLYLITFAMLVFVTGFAICGSEFQMFWLSIWAGAGLLWFFVFKSSWIILLRELRINP